VVYNFFVKDEGIGTVVGFFVYCFFSLFGLRYSIVISFKFRLKSIQNFLKFGNMQKNKTKI
jgi:hypothetical protein